MITDVITKMNKLLSSRLIVHGNKRLSDYLDNMPSGSSGAPIGSGMDYFGQTAPENYMFADGSAISRTEYAELFAIIGTMYGEGDGSTTFNLPDKREAISYMKGDNDTLGSIVGSNTHTLTKAEIPNYTLYNASHAHTQASHSHTIGCYADNNTNVQRPASTQFSSGLKGNFGTSGATPTIYGTTIKVDSGGSGQAMDIRQKSLVCNYIIKVK